jgi:signal transduction histidine kinase
VNKESLPIIDKLKTLLSEENVDYRSISTLTNALSKLDPNNQRFFIDARTLIHLGRDSIKDHTTALIELVKNSYDADAHNVDIEILCTNDSDQIRVSDNGFGMTNRQLLDNWLRIGFSGKRQSKLSKLGRRKTGEKGIGRISTDRLGAKIELISKTPDVGLVGLIVNWDDFDQEGVDVFDIDVKLTKPNSIRIPLKKGQESVSGTEIIITNLRQKWSVTNIQNLYQELSTLTSPFNKVEDFQIALVNDVSPEFSKVVAAKYYEVAEIDVTAIFDGTDKVYYSIKDRYTKQEVVSTIELLQFYSKANVTEGQSLTCGPIEVRLLFFLRDGSSVAGTDFKLSDLREFLNNNAGVKIFRDNIAVKPYGFPSAQMGYDWLGLGQEKVKNPAGIGRGDEFTVSPNQLVGAVFISRDNNTLLTDSAAREGFVESESFFDMKAFVIATKRLLETHRAEIYPVIEKSKIEKQKIPASREAEKIHEQLILVKDELNVLRNELETNSDKVKPQAFLKPIVRSIDKVETITEEVQETISELLNWQRVLNGLATIGISSAVFGHETEGSITQFQGSASLAIQRLKLTPPLVVLALEELEKSLKYSSKVAAWGAYALTRVQKEKRSKKLVKIYKTIENVAKELRPAFTASSINLICKGENFYSRTYQMDVETILVNLLTNAYSAATLKGGERIVSINVGFEDKDNQKGYYFSVADTGPGVAKEFQTQIFSPLFSTKSAGVDGSKSIGTGLGLTIVKSIVEELEGSVTFSTDEKLRGANFKVWLPKI